jgi:glycerophosphoryl diester phosphodiesterase
MEGENMGRSSRFGLTGVIGATVVAAALVIAPVASAVSPDPNPWLQKRFLVMAHQGGEDEAPSNTMFALKSAIQDRGADSLELDVNLSKDGQLMVIHDDTWSRIACDSTLCPGPDSSTELHRPETEVNDLTTAELQQLDAGYWFRPGTYSHDYSLPDTAYPYRGMRTGDVPPPTGYADTDFEIPTLKQVLDTFPDIPINIEIKMIKTPEGAAGGCITDDGTQYCDDPTASVPVADALANLLNQEPYASRDDLIVVSFSDALLSWFHEMDGPPYVALAPGVNDTTAFALSDVTPDPDVAAFQVPPDQSGIHVPEFLLTTKRAHCLGYAVHIWTNGDQDETPEAYRRFYDSGADGVMTSRPGAFSQWMADNDIPRPDPRDPLSWPIQCSTPPTQPVTPTPQAAPATKKKCKKKSKKAAESKKKKKKKNCKKGKKRRKK